MLFALKGLFALITCPEETGPVDFARQGLVSADGSRCVSFCESGLYSEISSSPLQYQCLEYESPNAECFRNGKVCVDSACMSCVLPTTPELKIVDSSNVKTDTQAQMEIALSGGVKMYVDQCGFQELYYFESELELKCLPACPDDSYAFTSPVVSYIGDLFDSYVPQLFKCKTKAEPCSANSNAPYHDGTDCVACNTADKYVTLEQTCATTFTPNEYNFLLTVDYETTNGTPSTRAKTVTRCPSGWVVATEVGIGYVAFECIAGPCPADLKHQYPSFGVTYCLTDCPTSMRISAAGDCLAECPVDEAPFVDMLEHKLCLAFVNDARPVLLYSTSHTDILTDCPRLAFNFTAAGEYVCTETGLDGATSGPPTRFKYENTFYTRCPPHAPFIATNASCVTTCEDTGAFTITQDASDPAGSTIPLARCIIPRCPPGDFWDQNSQECVQNCMPGFNISTTAECIQTDCGSAAKLDALTGQVTCLLDPCYGTPALPVLDGVVCVDRCSLSRPNRGLSGVCLEKCEADTIAVPIPDTVDPTKASGRFECKLNLCGIGSTAFYDPATQSCVSVCPNISGEQYWAADTARRCLTDLAQCPFKTLTATASGKGFRCGETDACAKYFLEGSPVPTGFKQCVSTCTGFVSNGQCLSECPAGQKYTTDAAGLRTCVAVCPSTKPLLDGTHCLADCPPAKPYSDASNLCAATCTSFINSVAVVYSGDSTTHQWQRCVSACPTGAFEATLGLKRCREPCAQFYLEDASGARECLPACRAAQPYYLPNGETLSANQCLEKCPAEAPYAASLGAGECLAACPAGYFRDSGFAGAAQRLYCVAECLSLYIAVQGSAQKQCLDQCPPGEGFQEVGATPRQCVADCAAGEFYVEGAVLECVADCGGYRVRQAAPSATALRCLPESEPCPSGKPFLGPEDECLALCAAGEYAVLTRAAPRSDTWVCAPECPSEEYLVADGETQKKCVLEAGAAEGTPCAGLAAHRYLDEADPRGYLRCVSECPAGMPFFSSPALQCQPDCALAVLPTAQADYECLQLCPADANGRRLFETRELLGSQRSVCLGGSPCPAFAFSAALTMHECRSCAAGELSLQTSSGSECVQSCVSREAGVCLGAASEGPGCAGRSFGGLDAAGGPVVQCLPAGENCPDAAPFYSAGVAPSCVPECGENERYASGLEAAPYYAAARLFRLDAVGPACVSTAAGFELHCRESAMTKVFLDAALSAGRAPHGQCVAFSSRTARFAVSFGGRWGVASGVSACPPGEPYLEGNGQCVPDCASGHAALSAADGTPECFAAAECPPEAALRQADADHPGHVLCGPACPVAPGSAARFAEAGECREECASGYYALPAGPGGPEGPEGSEGPECAACADRKYVFSNPRVNTAMLQCGAQAGGCPAGSAAEPGLPYLEFDSLSGQYFCRASCASPDYFVSAQGGDLVCVQECGSGPLGEPVWLSGGPQKTCVPPMGGSVSEQCAAATGDSRGRFKYSEASGYECVSICDSHVQTTGECAVGCDALGAFVTAEQEGETVCLTECPEPFFTQENTDSPRVCSPACTGPTLQAAFEGHSQCVAECPTEMPYLGGDSVCRQKCDPQHQYARPAQPDRFQCVAACDFDPAAGQNIDGVQQEFCIAEGAECTVFEAVNGARKCVPNCDSSFVAEEKIYFDATGGAGCSESCQTRAFLVQEDGSKVCTDAACSDEKFLRILSPESSASLRECVSQCVSGAYFEFNNAKFCVPEPLEGDTRELCERAFNPDTLEQLDKFFFLIDGETKKCLDFDCPPEQRFYTMGDQEAYMCRAQCPGAKPLAASNRECVASCSAVGGSDEGGLEWRPFEERSDEPQAKFCLDAQCAQKYVSTPEGQKCVAECSGDTPFFDTGKQLCKAQCATFIGKECFLESDILAGVRAAGSPFEGYFFFVDHGLAVQGAGVNRLATTGREYLASCTLEYPYAVEVVGDVKTYQCLPQCSDGLSVYEIIALEGGVNANLCQPECLTQYPYRQLLRPFIGSQEAAGVQPHERCVQTCSGSAIYLLGALCSAACDAADAMYAVPGPGELFTCSGECQKGSFFTKQDGAQRLFCSLETCADFKRNVAGKAIPECISECAGFVTNDNFCETSCTPKYYEILGAVKYCRAQCPGLRQLGEAGLEQCVTECPYVSVDSVCRPVCDSTHKYLSPAKQCLTECPTFYQEPTETGGLMTCLVQCPAVYIASDKSPQLCKSECPEPLFLMDKACLAKCPSGYKKDGRACLKSTTNRALIIGCSVGGAVLLIAVLIVTIICCTKKKCTRRQKEETRAGVISPASPRRVPLNQGRTQSPSKPASPYAPLSASSASSRIQRPPTNW